MGLDNDAGLNAEAVVAGLGLSHLETDPVAALLRLAEAGLLRECVPAAYGGAADRISLQKVCAVREALAYRSPLHDVMFVMQGLGSYAVTVGGTDEQRHAYLPKIAAGHAIGAFALTEPDAGSDVSAIATVAARDPDGGYALTGHKTFISNAGVATHYVVYARTGAHPSKGLSAFLVAASSPGLTVQPLELLCAGHPIGRVELRGVRVQEGARIGREGDGMGLALKTLGLFRTSVGAAAVGMARRALHESLLHVRRRQQFGKALGEFQATQLALAEMATEIEAAALLVQRAAHAVDAAPAGDGRSGVAVAMAKLHATETAHQVIDRALQLHGGSGLLSGGIIERLYREVRALRIYEGTSEIQKLLIARELLKG